MTTWLIPSKKLTHNTERRLPAVWSSDKQIVVTICLKIPPQRSLKVDLRPTSSCYGPDEGHWASRSRQGTQRRLNVSHGELSVWTKDHQKQEYLKEFGP